MGSKLAMAGAALALFALSAGAAQAQLSASRGPIAYSADALDYQEDKRLLVLTGNVDVTQDNTRLQADRLTITFKPSGSARAGGAEMGAGDIDRMIAEGRVFFVRPQQKARGDRAIYDTNTDTVTFSGNVVIASDDNVTRSDTVVLEISNQRTTFRPGAGRRVEGVIRPRGQSSAPARSGGR